MDVGSLISALPTGSYIGGTWAESEDGARFDVLNPADGRVLLSVADGSTPLAMRALDAASGAQGAWQRTPPRQRSEFLDAIYRLVLAHSEEFATLITLEMGKPLAESRAEVAYAADFLRWFSQETMRIGGEYRVAPDGNSRIVTQRRAVGPALLIAPWNFPLAMITRKLAPALAAGCTVILKPAEEAPLSSLLLVQLLDQLAVPPGVINLVTTCRPATVSAPLLADRRLRKISFTGSTPVGTMLLAAAAENVTRASMELGGNSSFLVFDDADLDAAADAVILAKFRNGGESCVAANRLLVHRDVHDEFVEKLLVRVRQLKIGNGFDRDSSIGPVINERQRQRIAGLVARAVDTGAEILSGGSPEAGAGYFYPPTLLVDVPNDSPIVSEEIFGPVLPVTAFESDDEAVNAANATPFGLVDYLFTRDVGRAFKTAEALEAGMIGINRGLVSNAAAPFGGTKMSGLGREGGFEGIDAYLETTYMALDTPAFE